MAAEVNALRYFAPHHFDGAPETSLITLGASPRGRPVWPQLTERQIAAENRESRGGQDLRECD
jgi:hypothetical protein